jgi:hypothetical protein
MSWETWLRGIGRDPSTGYRWIAIQMIDRASLVNIQGRLFITTEEIRRFWTRAKAGEFAKLPKGACSKPGPKSRL